MALHSIRFKLTNYAWLYMQDKAQPGKLGLACILNCILTCQPDDAEITRWLIARAWKTLSEAETLHCMLRQ